MRIYRLWNDRRRGTLFYSLLVILYNVEKAKYRKEKEGLQLMSDYPKKTRRKPPISGENSSEVNFQDILRLRKVF